MFTKTLFALYSIASVSTVTLVSNNQFRNLGNSQAKTTQIITQVPFQELEIDFTNDTQQGISGEALLKTNREVIGILGKEKDHVQ